VPEIPGVCSDEPLEVGELRLMPERIPQKAKPLLSNRK
jgi:hypothetical protein